MKRITRTAVAAASLTASLWFMPVAADAASSVPRPGAAHTAPTPRPFIASEKPRPFGASSKPRPIHANKAAEHCAPKKAC